jgi:hypothetical protein
MGKRIMAILVLFGFLAVLASCGISNIKVTRENYDKIQHGMTQEQVTEIIGKAGTVSESDMGEFGNVVMWHYQLGNKAIFVTFDNGKVIDKSWVEI